VLGSVLIIVLRLKKATQKILLPIHGRSGFFNAFIRLFWCLTSLFRKLFGQQSLFFLLDERHHGFFLLFDLFIKLSLFLLLLLQIDVYFSFVFAQSAKNVVNFSGWAFNLL